jgi:hypothetical protein
MTTSTTQPRLELKPTAYGSTISLKEPSFVTFYVPKVTKEKLTEYYKGTILPWLKIQQQRKKHDPAAPYAIEIYLIESVLVVVETAYHQPWELIEDLSQYFTEVNVDRLESPQSET